MPYIDNAKHEPVFAEIKKNIPVSQDPSMILAVKRDGFDQIEALYLGWLYEDGTVVTKKVFYGRHAAYIYDLLNEIQVHPNPDAWLYYHVKGEK